MDVALQSAETISAGRSPFQLFSAYTEKDRDKFFGREKETDLLYQSVQEANVVLVYGESGTGKTSIVQCGLLNETKHFNWTSILVRRGDDINVSLIQQLQKYGDNDVVNDDKDGVTTLMQEVFLNSFQPILLVFDQFEEIFVFGNPQEREAFAEKIAQIQGMRIPWKMVFIIREDFLAQLDEFEKELPDLFKKRLRIELMDKSHCREVIIKSCQVFKISLDPVRTRNGVPDLVYQPSTPDTPDDIINTVADKSNLIHLPYLQVFLDTLWKEARAVQPGAITIHEPLVKKVGSIGNVLKAFIEEKVNAQQILTPTDAWKLLKLFVPEKGTTRKKVRLNEYTAIDAAKLEELIGYFIDNKILTGCSEHIYELAHESLVPVIQQVKLNEIRARLTVPTILRDPYKGLSSFTEGDKNMFFGRKEAVKMVYEKITQHDLVVIVGNSGTGKSSLIKAGVWPLLEKDGYTVMDPIRAGERPVAFLGSRLEEVACDKENNKFLLLIDQYEELTTRIGQEEIRDTVARKLYEALEKQRTGASPCKIKFVITIRADFEPQFRIIKPLDDYWNAGKYFVPPFTREEIREVIEEPAYQAGLEFSPPSLVEEIMEEVYSSQSTGMLPLMSFTLKELYDRYVKSGRNDNLLREEDYQQLGGVIGGLQNRAKQVYEAFKEEYPESYDRYRNMMRNIILRMIYLSTGELAGQRAQAEDLIYINDETNEIKQNILDKLIESHLVVTGIDCADKVYYEPAHDVLVRSWGQIWDWIREVGDVKLSSRRRLTQAVNDYINSNKDEKLLWDNKWLDELEPEVKDENTWLNKKEFDFVTASLQKREAAAALIRSYEEEKDRQQQERDAYQKNKIKRTRTFSVITLILLSIALVMFGWAMKNGQAAKKSQLLAEKSREAAVKRREEAVYNYKVAMQINERNKQLMLSLQDKNGILAAQRDSVDAARKLAELAAAKEKAERKKADQLVKERDSEIAIRKKTEDDLKQRTDDLQQRTNALNAKVAYADSINRELKAAFLALQLQRSQNVTQLTGISKSLEKNDLVKAYRVAQLAFAKDSSNREVAEQYGKLANKPAYYYTREMEGDYAAISPSGEYLLATSSRDQMLRLRHMGTYQLIDSVAVPGLLSAVFSSSSRSLLLTYNNKVEIRRVSNLRDKNNFRINERNIVAAAMAPDESRLLLVADGQLQVRRVLFNGEMPVREYTVRTGEKIVSAVFSDDSKHIISGSLNGNIRLWDASSGKAIEQSTVKNITSSYISPKGNCFIISTPTELYIYNGYGERIKVIDQGNYGKFSKALFSNDGQQVLLSFNATYAKFQMNEQQVIKGDYNSNKNAAILLNIKTARILHVTEFIPGEDLSGLTATVGAMPVILNGNQLLYGLDHGTIKLITLTNGNREILAGYNVPVTSLFMNAAPELIVTGAENNVIRIWQYNTARRLDLQGVLPKLSNEELAKLGIKN